MILKGMSGVLYSTLRDYEIRASNIDYIVSRSTLVPFSYMILQKSCNLVHSNSYFPPLTLFVLLRFVADPSWIWSLTCTINEVSNILQYHPR